MALSGRYRHSVEWLDGADASQGSTRAHIRGVNAREAEIAGLDTGLVAVSIRMRAHPTIRPAARWTAVHGSTRYSIQGSYDPTGKGRELVVVGVEAT